ncbi:MAG: 4Fe-4S dicluster domain-containing protein [Candidatus Eisenbacteria bacterium]|nr:4Fe-4S dicluster domain-containing protein [Candidatus Eisenbacteria bacterium]
MAQEIRIEPALLSCVRRFGKFDVGGCFNCGSCTITCPLSKDSASFPRRTIRYVHYGLKDKLRTGLEPWLCYYCGDCAVTCPHQAEPGEAMMTLRRYLSSQYDWTGLSSRLYRSGIARFIASLFVAGLVFLLVLFYHLKFVEALQGVQAGDFLKMSLGLSHMFGNITYFTYVVFLIPVVLMITNAFRMYWLSIHKDKGMRIPPVLFLKEMKTLLLHGFAQMRFRECTDKTRWVKHLILFGGFALISILVLFFLKWFQTDNIYPIYHPQRWLGYLATLALLYGSGESLLGRIRKKEQVHRFSSFSDWSLPTLIFLTALTGIAVHIFRYLGFAMTAHYAYFVHMVVVVPMLIVEIPFGKLGHAVYRPLGLYFQAVKESALGQEAVSEAKAA